MVIRWVCASTLGAVFLACSPALASPPPPPPAETVDVANLLIADEGADTTAKLSSFVADDVQVYVNGSLVAAGKASWTRYLADHPRRLGDILTYGQGWEPDGIASLMVIDQFDTADRSKLPARAIMDPRMATRATLYQFRTDRKIHVIQSLSGAGFWINPKR